MMENRKVEAMVAKQRRTRRGISLFSKKKKNDESDIEDRIDLDQAIYLLQL